MELAEALYNAIAQAETGSFNNPWIRTTYAPAGGSTAFGPVQITRTKVDDYANRGLISQDAIDFYRQILTPMYANFMKYGKEPNKQGYNPAYDYGGGGMFDEQYRDEYQDLARQMLLADYNQAGGNVDKFIRLWRGTGNDQRYNKVVKSKLEEK